MSRHFKTVDYEATLETSVRLGDCLPADHLARFIADPVAYAPQYGGLCADGVAYDQATANIDPGAWRIIDGKLYLNYDTTSAAEFHDTAGFVAKADANWPKIRLALP